MQPSPVEVELTKEIDDEEDESELQVSLHVVPALVDELDLFPPGIVT
jgi:hypothetical protein